MITIFCCLGIYAVGCVLAIAFFFTGRWPSLLERNLHWPVALLWPLVLLWPFRGMARMFRRTAPVAKAALQPGYNKPVAESLA
jgi:hypothetical protein